MALEDAFKKLGDALDDLSSLETFTYRGDIEAIVKTSGEDGFRAALDEARTEGKLHLLLYTRLDADGDSVNIHGTGGVDQSLIDAHKAAFDMGRSSTPLRLGSTAPSATNATHSCSMSCLRRA